MILDLLLSQWKLVLIAALIAALSFQTHRLSNAEEKIVEVSTRFQLAKDAAEAEAKKAQDISTRTAKEINDGIPKLVEQAKINAVENYQRRYGRLARPDVAVDSSDRPSLGNGIHADGVRLDAGADTISATPTGSPEGVAGESVGISLSETCIPDPRFLNDAATAAAVIDGWLTWATKNGFEYEK